MNRVTLFRLISSVVVIPAAASLTQCTEPAPHILQTYYLSEGYKDWTSSTIWLGVDVDRPATVRCSIDDKPYVTCPWNGMGLGRYGVFKWTAQPAAPEFAAGLKNGSHTIRFKAVNNAGNFTEYPARDQPAIDFTLDMPVVTVTTPVGVGTATSNCVAVDFSAEESRSGTAGGGDGTFTYWCSLDSATRTGCTTGQTYCGLTRGSHTVLVTAQSKSYDQGVGTQTFVIGGPDTHSPVVKITKPAGGSMIDGDRFVNWPGQFSEWTIGEAGTTNRCKLDSGSWWECSRIEPLGTSDGKLALAVDHAGNVFSTVANGWHTLSVEATDAAGNSGTATSSFQVSQVTIDAPADRSVSTSRSVSVRFTPGTGQSAALHRCTLDSAPGVVCPQGYIYSGLTDGEHTIRVFEYTEEQPSSPINTIIQDDHSFATTTFRVKAGQ